MRPGESRLKGAIQSGLRIFGFQVIRFRRQRWLSDHGIRSVIDVGANTGQFAALARDLLPSALIYSFEPIEECFRELERRFHRDPRFRAFPYALGAERGTATFFLNEFTPSSSLLAMEQLHRRTFPYTATSSEITVEVRTLDEFSDGLDLPPELLVKLDVQGYEDRVIRGGEKLVRQAKVVIVEVSFEPLYTGQVLFSGIYHRLTELGFLYHGNLDQLISPTDSRVLSADAIFIRP